MRPYIPVEVARRVFETAHDRCGYCLSPRHFIMARLEIEHIVPLAQGGSSDESNLWLACPICNRHKSDKISAVDPETGEEVPLFNPRNQTWVEHFQWSEDGLRILGLTPVGRATVSALYLSDDEDAITVRSYWIIAGWHPPQNSSAGAGGRRFAAHHAHAPTITR